MSIDTLLRQRLVIERRSAGSPDSEGHAPDVFADYAETPGLVQDRSEREIEGPRLGETVIANAHGFLPSAAVLTERDRVRLGTIGVSAVQTVLVAGGPTGGTFRLSYLGAPSSAIAFGANAAAVQAALETIGALTANVTVSGTNPSFTVTFGGSLALAAVSPLVVAVNSLTGGVTPSVVIVQATLGLAPTTVTDPLSRPVRYEVLGVWDAAGVGHHQEFDARRIKP